MSNISDKQQQLVETLKELFMMDQADLDFGIYRIMNAKHNEIESFLHNDLLPTIQATLQSGGKGADVQKELDELVKTLQEAGVNPDDSPKVKDLKALLGDGANNSLEKDEAEIFSQLTTFFSRYYDGGDFMSLRRYKQETYSPLPMNGEEVKLHWANADQYYIKSAEAFSNYAFKIGEGTVNANNADNTNKNNNKKTVRFELVQASTEQNNKKETTDKERRFILDENQPVSLRQKDEGEELILHFNYQADADKRKQKDLNLAAIDFIRGFDGSFDGRDAFTNKQDWQSWQTELLALKPTGKNKKRTVLEKYLMDYTAKNSFDYFIHKDLGGFLKRELNFFIKNELLLLDDIVPDNGDAIDSQLLSNERSLKKMVAFKVIAQKLIAFLAQLENFQKKLWLKKKFVLESNYCMTLDRVPESFYEEIAGNQAQIDEWVELGFIDKEITKDTKVTKEYLKENPYLLIDTGLFSEDFKQRLLADIDDLNETTDGLLIHSENFQALNLIQERYREQVKCVYIDPPYNTGKNDFLYKDNYQHSSWLSFISDRIEKIYELLDNNGALFCSIDDNEAQNIEKVCNSIFGKEQLLVPFFIQVRYANKTLSEDNDFQRTIERVFFYAKDKRDFTPVKDKVDYPVEKFEWIIIEKSVGSKFLAGGKECAVFKPDEYEIKKIKPNLKGLKETWATGSLLRQKGSSGEFFGLNLAPRKDSDGIGCLYKVSGIGEDGLGYRYFTGPKKESASRGKFYSGIPLQTLEKIKSGDAKKDIPIHNFLDFSGDFGNCRHEGNVDIQGGKKPEKLVERLVSFTSNSNQDIVFDPFCGSGTTPSVAHKLNKKYVAIEQSGYFDSKVIKRMKYTLHGSAGGLDSMILGGCFKYIRLESYEDVVDNLQLQRTEQQADLLNNPDNKTLKEDYLLNYMLDIEAKGSLFSRELFIDPFNAKIRVVRDNESREQALDLVETFNYLLGLRVESTRRQKGIVEVIGKNPTDESVHIIWRNQLATDNDALDDWFRKQSYNTRDMEFDRVYVNGDNNLPNLKTSEESWKVQLIEEAFETLMFDCQDV